MERYVCIHGHFYQPPRENPWLEAIELQESAYPYHDWNERVSSESYAPNAAARILDARDRIVRIVNNYASISFNFGPTLLAWMEQHDPGTLQAILEADRQSRRRFGGHGSALAQVYNHMILPLANPRDKRTQILWGLQDFRHRFNREPEGLWLPETAVDLETLSLVAEAGLAFTVLAPHQAKRTRPLGGGEWRDVSDGRVDPTCPYLVRLPSGGTLTVFFYDGPIARATAFEGLLSRGDNLAQRLLSAFDAQRSWPQLVHIATDGETYGHHHRHGEMALAYALHLIAGREDVRLTNYGQYLERHPPIFEAEILSDTSWSCIHGVERWRSDCGCNTGGHPTWNQAWRAPLRSALDWLRDSLASLYESQAGAYLRDPWQAREDYIHVVLDRSPESIEAFLGRQLSRELQPAERVQLLKLMELQRHAMLMFTSCGWFFDEISGIETLQVLQYAARAIQLGRECLAKDLEPGFLDRLQRARSNLPDLGDGRRIYERFIRPAMVDLASVGAHYAVSSVFEDYEPQAAIYSYAVSREAFRRERAGRARLVVGRAQVDSEVTREAERFEFGVLHLGDHNLHGVIRQAGNEAAYEAFEAESLELFHRADIPDLFRVLDRHMEAPSFSLHSLFRDEQQRIVNRILEESLLDVEAAYRRIYQDYAPLMRYLADQQVGLPRAFEVAAEFILNTSLRRTFAEIPLDITAAEKLLAEAAEHGVQLDDVSLRFTLEGALAHEAQQLVIGSDDIEALERFERSIEFVGGLPFRIDLWQVQNAYHELLQRQLPNLRRRQERGDTAAAAWVSVFLRLGEKLSFRIKR